MGIRSLTGFVDANPHLLQAHMLADTRVIIDGNNLCHILYRDSNVEHVLGGDYDKFYQCAKRYFAAYAHCNITPYVIFDGGYDSSDMKLQTTLDRLTDRLQTMCAHSKGHMLYKRTLPVMALEVLRDVLEDLGISHAQCDFEADNQIVALANHFSCPVLSLDSDFYIFDVKGGFIPLNSVDTTKKRIDDDDDQITESEYYLDCQMYRIDNFLHHFKSLDRSVLPLFATVMGNDFMDAQLFTQFFENIRLPKIKSKKLQVGQRHRKMIGLLCWLQSQTADKAIEKILGYITNGKQKQQMRQLIIQSMENYTRCNPTLVQALGLDSNTTTQPYKLTTRSGKELPVNFSNAFCQMRLPPFFLNVVGLRRVFLLSQAECLSAPSSYFVSRHIREIIYGILLSNEKSQIVNNIVVQEYDRQRHDMVKSTIVPKWSLPKYGPLPSLDQIPSLTKLDAKNIYCEVFHVERETFELFPSNIQLPLILLKYWICKCSQKMKDIYVNAALMCLLRLSVFSEIQGSKEDEKNVLQNETAQSSFEINQNVTEPEEKPMNEDFPMDKLTWDEINPVKNGLKKFFQKQDLKKFKPDVAVLHVFAEYQTVLLFGSYLNKLLEFPFDSLKMGGIFNGTFFGNFCRELNKRSYPDLYMSELLGRRSSCCSLFFNIRNMLLDNIQCASILMQENTKPKQENTKPQKKNKNASKSESQAAEDVSESCVVEERKAKKKDKIVSHVGLCNKFDQLMNLDSDSSVEFECLSELSE